ncbi:MAG: RidA family protein [Acidimicrobiia bacterium]|nr:RidA family protein [Acidimicrobiia bacterium]
MAFQHINPDGAFDPSSIYSHIVIAPPGRMVFFAGQWGGDPTGELVAGGFANQVTQAFANVRTQLAAAGIGPGEVTKLTHYVVDLDQEKRAALHGVVGSIWPDHKPAATLLGIARLAREGMFYEVDVQAVIPDA